MLRCSDRDGTLPELHKILSLLSLHFTTFVQSEADWNTVLKVKVSSLLLDLITVDGFFLENKVCPRAASRQATIPLKERSQKETVADTVAILTSLLENACTMSSPLRDMRSEFLNRSMALWKSIWNRRHLIPALSGADSSDDPLVNLMGKYQDLYHQS